MFTGIVDHAGTVRSKQLSKQGVVFRIESRFSDLVSGESVSVDGACLTVTDIARDSFAVEVSPETLGLTTLGGLVAGSQVNLERALRLTDRLGGHWVTGHIDGTLEVHTLRAAGEFIEIELAGVAPAERGYVTKKGSVALSGVSLTVNEVLDSAFRIMVIPHTLERTTLSHLRTGDRVNVEYDWMAKIVVKEVRALWSERAPHE